MNCTIPLIACYWKRVAFCTWCISFVLAIGLCALADFGGPPWIFILCGLWLCSFGLPTTLSLLSVAALWENPPWLPTLPTFAVYAAIISFAVQTMSVLIVIRFLSHSGINEPNAPPVC